MTYVMGWCGNGSSQQSHAIQKKSWPKTANEHSTHTGK